MGFFPSKALATGDEGLMRENSLNLETKPIVNQRLDCDLETLLLQDWGQSCPTGDESGFRWRQGRSAARRACGVFPRWEREWIYVGCGAQSRLKPFERVDGDRGAKVQFIRWFRGSWAPEVGAGMGGSYCRAKDKW